LTDFNYFRIKDLCNVTSSKRIYRSEYVESGIPFYRGKEIIELSKNRQIGNPLYISEQRYEEIRERFGVPKKNDILMISIGATLGIPYLLNNNRKFYFKDGNVTWFKDFNQKVYSPFLFTWLKSSYGNRVLWSNIIGSAQPALTLDSIKNIQILLPSITIQQKIASVLSTYDKLIENNTRRIRILEETAQRIYKEWFVDFKYPGHQNDQLVDSELGAIPEGWEVNNIVDIPYFRFIRENIPEFDGSKIYFATADVQGTWFVKDGIEYEYHNKPSRAQKQPIINSIWFARMKDSYKIAIYTMINEKDAENSILSSGFAGFQSNEKYFGYLHAIVSSKEFDTLKNLYATGATQVSLNNDGLKRILFPIATEKIIIEFSDTIKPLIDQSILLKSQNENLKQTRDCLLPKLISGKVDVSDLDIDTGILDD
jgi:type I restriction enzyme, S subunit